MSVAGRAFGRKQASVKSKSCEGLSSPKNEVHLGKIKAHPNPNPNHRPPFPVCPYFYPMC